MKIKHYMPITKRSGLWKIQGNYFTCLQNGVDDERWSADILILGNEKDFTDKLDFERLDRIYIRGYAVQYIKELKKDYFYDDLLKEGHQDET